MLTREPDTAGGGGVRPGELDAAVGRALDFLRRSQLPSGEFKAFMSTDNSLERDCVVDSSPFPTALIAYSLGFADPAAAGPMLEKAVRFFVAEMEGPGLWRYWTKQHRYHSVIPFDLDDVACVSYVLRRHGVAFPANAELILANRSPAGLFYTWMTPRWPPPLKSSYLRVVLRQWLSPLKLYYFWKLNESAPNDVDCVVNANVLFYVGESEATRPVVEYLIEIARRGGEACCDKWHLNPFTFYYVVARNFHAGVAAFESVREEVVGRIVAAANEDGRIGENALETALAACALLYWGSAPPELGRAVRYLLTGQRPAGDWPRAALYFGGPKKYYGWGSEELTTGFCLEALLRYSAAR
ncbi:MAG TPA: hypothetical protein VN228_04910 [Pyrinomonadaceae bacterium]|nr:hypothetical protein [Pyrinomonadaceae bacterium]